LSPDWYSRGEVAQLVQEYCVVLDSVLRDKPEMHRLLAWCRHCGIPFIAHPCNAGRVDLGCPFGCAGFHRHRNSNVRSAKCNRKPETKRKRFLRRKQTLAALAAGHPAAEDSPSAKEPPGEPVKGDQAISGSTEPPSGERRGDHPCPPPEESPPATDRAPSSADFVGGGPVLRGNEDGDGASPRDRRRSAGSVPAGLEGIVIARRMLSYIRVVISLIEGRYVHREEILEMFARRKRQHSLVRERRIDYVLRRLGEEPEKPP
jgi:hypothetical protein